MTYWLERLPLQTKIIALVTLVVAIALLFIGIIATTLIVETIEKDVEKNLMDKAFLIANMQEIKEAMKSDNPSSILQPIAISVYNKTAVEIVIINMQGIRYTHVNENLIGKRISGGDEGPALQGKAYNSKASGVSGPTIRSYVPIFDNDGTQIGVAAAGKLVEKVTPLLKNAKLFILYNSLISLFVGSFGAVLLSNHIKSSIFNLEPYQIAKILKERTAIMEAILEGVVAFDQAGKISTVNKAARKILNLEHHELQNLLNNSIIEKFIKNKKVLYDQELQINGVLVLANIVPIRVNDNTIGTVMTFRDKTEIKRLAEEITGLRQYTEALRAQSHEFNNKLHTINGLIQLACYDEVVEYVSETFADCQHEADMITKHIKDPTICGLLLGKLSQAKELDINFVVDPNTMIREKVKNSQTLVTIIGNLIENGFDAVKSLEKDRRMVNILLKSCGKELAIHIRDKGSGISPKVLPEIFEKGVSTKEGSRGIGLYLTKKEIESLDGEIRLSTETTGTEFIVIIPTLKCSGGDAI